MRTAKAAARLQVVGAAPVIESKYEALFDQASDAILTVLQDGSIDAANQAVEEMSGYLKSELVGARIEMLVPDPAKLPRHARPLNPELFTTPGTYEDVAILRKDGYVKFVDFVVRIVTSDGGGIFALALFRDITEKKRMERELITKHTELRNAYVQLERKNAELHAMQETLVQSGKMAALGELAAGIAHELNQPLQGIRGYTQELQYLFKTPTPESDAALKEVISNVDKMAGIIDYLRAFTRKSVENYEFTSVHHAIEEALKMLSRQFAARGIAVEKNFAAELPEIYANPLQLEQVFINLATNARDAIESTGRGRGHVSITTKVSGKLIEITFKDDGCGMGGRTKTKIFNPFFTTKEVGQGMGLGLSLSFGILSKLQGSIVVESEIGKGAEFIIRIPQDFRELA
jgi:PAS domain S-box-containing protein